MTDNLKLAVVRGNVAAMKNLILEIEKTLELDEADLSNATPEKTLSACVAFMVGYLAFRCILMRLNLWRMLLSASGALIKIKAPDYSGVSFVHTNENRPIWISKQFSVNCQPTIKQLSGCTQNSNLIFFSFQRLFSNNAGAGGASLVISVAAV